MIMYLHLFWQQNTKSKFIIRKREIVKNFIDLAFPKESADNYYQNQTKAAVDNFMYIEKEWFEKIFEPSTYYILGPKGSGKTLYAAYMCAHVRKNSRGY